MVVLHVTPPCGDTRGCVYLTLCPACNAEVHLRATITAPRARTFRAPCSVLIAKPTTVRWAQRPWSKRAGTIAYPWYPRSAQKSPRGHSHRTERTQHRTICNDHQKVRNSSLNRRRLFSVFFRSCSTKTANFVSYNASLEAQHSREQGLLTIPSRTSRRPRTAYQTLA